MTYALRNEEAGYHHVGMRGNNKQRIYLNDRDRELFLTMLDFRAAKHGWRILAYALMRNHYHLVAGVDGGRLASGMCELNTGYAVSFNTEYGRKNHLFGRRYWNDVATTDEHLKAVVRYVLQNPRRAGAKGPLESHKWTSYRASVGLEFGLAQFARDELLSFFGTRPKAATRAFIEYCNEPATSLVPPSHVGWQPPERNAPQRAT